VDGTHAAALNQDGTVNSAANPVAPGSIVSVFATGLGPITPLQADGSSWKMPLPVNQLPVSLQRACVGNLDCVYDLACQSIDLHPYAGN
jgi:uncharacterized protein (TIGR03437 family)